VVYLLELGLLKFVERTSQSIRFEKLAAWMSKYQKKYRRSTISSAVVSMDSKEGSFDKQNFEKQVAALRTEIAKLQSQLPHQAPQNTNDASFDSCVPVPPSYRDHFDPSNGRRSVDNIARSGPRDAEQAFGTRMNHVSVNDESVSPLSSPDHRSQQPSAFAVSPLRRLAPSQARRIVADPDDFLADDADLSAYYVAHAPSIPSQDSPRRTLAPSGLTLTPRRKILADAIAADFVDLTAEDVPSAFFNASSWTTNQQSPPYEAEPRSPDPPPKGQTWARRERDEAALSARMPGPPRVAHTTLVGPSVFPQSSVVTTQALQYLANTALYSGPSSSSHRRQAMSGHTSVSMTKSDKHSEERNLQLPPVLP
jgi:hypothetical protein